MPGGDRTGPMGYGPMTGRGAGYCAGYDVPGYMNPGPGLGRGRGFGYGRGMGWGRGYGRGMGRGRGWRAGYAYGAPAYPAAPYNAAVAPKPEDEAQYLRTQAEMIQDELKAINERISELEQKKESAK